MPIFVPQNNSETIHSSLKITITKQIDCTSHEQENMKTKETNYQEIAEV